MKKFIFILMFSFFTFEAYPIIKINKEELASRRPGLTTPSVQKRLKRAFHYLSKENYKDAVRILKNIIPSTAGRKYERAKVNQALGFALAQNENFKGATKALNESLNLNVLGTNDTLQILFALSQLEFMGKKYKSAINYIDSWFSIKDKPAPNAFILKASILYELKKMDEALVLVEKAISLTKTPAENWLVFAISLYFQKEDFSRAAYFLKVLADQHPNKKSYWMQLAGNLLNLNQSERALSVLQLAYMFGHVSEEGEILNIAGLYLNHGLPYEASKLLEKAIEDKRIQKNKKNFELLANSLIQSRELTKALTYLAIASRFAKDGELFTRQGRIYLEQENWNKAIDSYKKGLEKGKIKKMGSVFLEIGIAFYNMKKIDQAKLHFKKALKFKESKNYSKKWLEFIEKESQEKVSSNEKVALI